MLLVSLGCKSVSLRDQAVLAVSYIFEHKAPVIAANRLHADIALLGGRDGDLDSGQRLIGRRVHHHAADPPLWSSGGSRALRVLCQ